MKKVLYILGGALVLLLIVASCLYFIPTKSTAFDLTLDARKTDNNGNELGTVPITVRGTLTEYLFRDDRISIEISPIEDLYDVKPWDVDYFNSTDIGQPNEHGFYSLVCSASSTIVGEDSYLLMIYFWEDLSNWQLFRTYRIGANSEFEQGDRRELDFTYRATVE